MKEGERRKERRDNIRAGDVVVGDDPAYCVSACLRGCDRMACVPASYAELCCTTRHHKVSLFSSYLLPHLSPPHLTYISFGFTFSTPILSILSIFSLHTILFIVFFVDLYFAI